MTREGKKKLESSLAIAAIVAIMIAWLVGRVMEDADIQSAIKREMPQIARLQELEKATYEVYNAEDEFLGYLTLESSMGYGGPLQMGVLIDSLGAITELSVISSKETPSYLDKVLESRFLEKLIGRTYSEEYAIGDGIDAFSSATYSSRAIVEASKKGNRYLASEVLGKKVPETVKPSIHFGHLEIILVLLFAIGYIAHKKTFKHQKAARWVTMLLGLFVLGFSSNQPFTLSMINQLLLGYFPPLHSHLYWYLLLGGIFLVLTIDNKNPYCQWFCPFGAAQECMGLIGGAKVRPLGKWKYVFKWTLRSVVLAAIIIALLFRNPGITSYEVFGTLFKLTGSNLQFAILGIVLVTSIFVKRPWCNYICPAGPLFSHFMHIKRLIKEQLKKGE